VSTRDELRAQKTRAYFVGWGNMAETGTNTKPRACRPFAQAAMRATETG
jgi:hypothetical protein